MYTHEVLAESKRDEATREDMETLENRLARPNETKRLERRFFAYHGTLGIGRNSRAIERAASIRGNR